MRLDLSIQIILGLYTISLANEMEGLGVINILLWTRNSGLVSFDDTFLFLSRPSSTT